MWSSIKWDRGMVVVDEETVVLLSLDERARPFPWNPSKRVYVLNTFHQLHCLVSIVIFLFRTTIDLFCSIVGWNL